MTGEEIKETVREHYGKIAIEGSSCCASGCGCDDVDTDIITVPVNAPYHDDEREIADAADLGLGCGTPTRFAGLKEGMTVLDLGSGAGIDVFIAAKKVGPSGKVIGLDMTEAMIERAEKNKQKLGIQNAEFRKGEIEQMPIESGSVDLVLSNCVLNLVPDKQKAFSEVYRVLKSGGTFAVSDIVTEGNVTDEYRNNPDLWAGCVSGAEEKSSYLGIIQGTGFRDVRVAEERSFPAPGQTPFKVMSITVTGRK